MEDWKRITPRSKKYRAYIARHPCHTCGGPHTMAAHGPGQRGWAIKASDFTCLPLDLKCHNEQHKGHETFAMKHGFNYYAAAFRYMYPFVHKKPAPRMTTAEAEEAFRALHIEFTGVTV